MSIAIHRRVKFFASSITLLVFLTCYGANSKHDNYTHILENPYYRNTLSLLAPEKIFTNHDNASDTKNETWLISTCRRDLLILKEAIIKREVWALTMLDASSKLQSGLLQGNLDDFGQYEECLAVHSNTSNNDIRGRHCLYSITASLGNISLNLTLAVCLPATCSSDDIVMFFNHGGIYVFNTTISWIDELKDLSVKITSAKCTPGNRVMWDLEIIVCLIILLGYIIFLVACTIKEVSHKSSAAGHNKHPFVSCLAAFSLRKSAASLLNMNIKEGTLPALDGIRFLSTALIVLYHQHLTLNMVSMSNPSKYQKWLQSWDSLHIFVSLYAVDTFFVMSGFLMTYSFFKLMKKKKRFNVPMHYFHRYMRLTPTLIALLVIAIVIIPKLGSGVLWDGVSRKYIDSCRTKWWFYLIYLHNFLGRDNMCLQHLWYLAVDMQFLWISPLILYPLYKNPKYGLIILGALFFASLAIPATVIGIRKLPVVSRNAFFFGMTLEMEIFNDIYVNPIHRAGAWLIGILLGYEVAMHNRQLDRWTVIVGWLTAIACFVFCTFGTRSFMDPDYEYNVVWETFFSTISRSVWALGVSWIIYSSINNREGPISSILSSRIFLPLGKLSYCVYLIHYILQILHGGSVRTPVNFQIYDVWYSFFGTLMISLGAAFLFSLLFEAPIIVLENILFGRKRESHSQNHLKRNKEEEPGTGNENFSLSNINITGPTNIEDADAI